MGLSHEHVGSTIPAKINTYMLTRAELLIHLCYETPCIPRGTIIDIENSVFTILSCLEMLSFLITDVVECNIYNMQW